LSDKWWVSQYNFVDEVRADLRLPEKVTVHDITLRDGEQQAGIVFRKDDKIKIAKMLDEVGVHRIEAGMPGISAEDKEAVKAIAHSGLNAKVFCFCRCMKVDVDLALECDVDGVEMEIPSSEHIIRDGYGWPLEKAVDLSVQATKYAADHGLHVAFFTIDSTRADFDWWSTIITKVATEGHMDSMVLVDTFGVCAPEAIRYFVRKARQKISKPFEAHFHNDFGLATANTLAAACEGVEILHTTVNGIGERQGNTALEEVTLALEALYGVKVGLDYKKLYELSKLVEKLSGVKMPPQKPVVGDGAFRVESGIIAGWWSRAKELGKPLIMYPYTSDSVGQKGVQIVIGKKSGRDSIIYKLKELGLHASEDQIDAILKEVKAESFERKSELNDNVFMEIVKKHGKQKK